MSEPGSTRSRLRTVAPLLCGVAGLGLLVTHLSPSQVVDGLRAFDPRLVPVLLALAVIDYVLRFWRWHLLVKLATGCEPPFAANAAVFLAANALILTPARIGDLSRSVYARELYGAPVASTASVTLLERVVDVVLMALMAIGGALLFGCSPAIALAGLGLAAAAVGVLASRRATDLAVAMIRRVAGGTRAAQALSLLDTLRSLWRPKPLVAAVTVGALAWGVECVAFFVVLCGLDLQPTPALAGQAAFIYPLANLAGSLSLLPGGLGVAEGSIAGLTRSLTGASPATALAAALIIRAAIVGCGVLSGLPGVVLVARLAGRVPQRGDAPETLSLERTAA